MMSFIIWFPCYVFFNVLFSNFLVLTSPLLHSVIYIIVVVAIMGKKKQNSVSAASKAKKDFKQRLATANVSSKISKVNKFKSTKPVVKNLKKIVNETRGKVSTANDDFDKLQSQIYSAKKKEVPQEKKQRNSFERLNVGREGVSATDMDAALAQFSNFYPLAAKK